MKNGPGDYILRVASVDTGSPTTHEIDLQGKKARLRVEYGDFSLVLKRVNDALQEVGLVSPFFRVILTRVLRQRNMLRTSTKPT